MSNPDLPDGWVNGGRYLPDDDFDWEQPDATVIHVYAGDTCEARMDDAGNWIDVTYSPASVDKRVALESARAEFVEATISASIPGLSRRAVFIFGS